MIIKDLINPRKWWDYFIFLIRKFTGWTLERFGFNTPEDLSWKSEVIVYRGLLCPECKIDGKCVGIPNGELEACGCDFVGKSTDMSLECSCGMWKAVKDKEDWEKQKANYYSNFKLGFLNAFK